MSDSGVSSTVTIAVVTGRMPNMSSLSSVRVERKIAVYLILSFHACFRVLEVQKWRQSMVIFVLCLACMCSIEGPHVNVLSS